MPGHTLDMSVQSIHNSMENALKTAVEGFCQSGKFARVMNSAMQRVIEVKSTYHGQYTNSTARYSINSSSSTGGQSAEWANQIISIITPGIGYLALVFAIAQQQ